MKKQWLIFTMVSLFLMGLTGSAFAWSSRNDENFHGRPIDFRSDGHKGYYIWQDEHGFHVWTTTRGEEHTFSGVIHTDGIFEHVRGHRLEEGDSLTTYEDIQDKTWFRFGDGDRGFHFAFGGREVNVGHDKINFKFNTAGGSDGLNFRIRDARHIDFDLFIDGHPIPRRDIFIGTNGWHPDDHHFRLDRY